MGPLEAFWLPMVEGVEAILLVPTLLPVTAEPIELEEDLLPAVADVAFAVLVAFAAA